MKAAGAAVSPQDMVGSIRNPFHHLVERIAAQAVFFKQLKVLFLERYFEYVTINLTGIYILKRICRRKC